MAAEGIEDGLVGGAESWFVMSLVVEAVVAVVAVAMCKAQFHPWYPYHPFDLFSCPAVGIHTPST
jgi:hypothetical protein